MAKTLRQFTIWQGGSNDHFKSGRTYDEAYLRRSLNEKLKPFATHFFPGLIVQDEEGNLYRPRAVLSFVPHTPEGMDG